MKTFVMTICTLFVISSFVLGQDLPYQNSSSSQEIEFGQFEVGLQTNNYEEETREYVDDQTGEVFYWHSPERADGSLYINAEQSNELGNVIPFGNSFDIQPNKNNGLTVTSNFQYIFIDEDIEDWMEPPQGNLDLDFNNIRLNSYIRTEHEENWFWEEGEDEPTVTRTLDINSSFDFSMDQVQIVDSEIRIDDFTVNSDDQMWEGITIGSRFDVEWTGEPEEFSSFFGTFDSPSHYGGGGGGGSVSAKVVKAVPEPGTLTLLLTGLVGFIAFIRRKLN